MAALGLKGLNSSIVIFLGSLFKPYGFNGRGIVNGLAWGLVTWSDPKSLEIGKGRKEGRNLKR